MSVVSVNERVTRRELFEGTLRREERGCVGMNELMVASVGRSYKETKRDLKTRYRNRVLTFSAVGGFCGVMSSVFVRDFADVTSLLVGVMIGLIVSLCVGGLSYRRALRLLDENVDMFVETVVRPISMFERAEMANRVYAEEAERRQADD